MIAFEQRNESTENIFQHTSEYIDARWKLEVLKASEKAAKGIADLTTTLIFTFIFMIVLIFMSLSVAWGLGQLFNSMALGFFGVGVFYVLVGILLWFVKDQYLKLPLINTFLKKLYSEDEDRKY